MCLCVCLLYKNNKKKQKSMDWVGGKKNRCGKREVVKGHENQGQMNKGQNLN